MGKLIRVFTDGACSGNPGPGGWATLFHHCESISMMQGGEDETTNNRMELRAVVEVFKEVELLSEWYEELQIHSDSAYVVNGVNKGWLQKWNNNSWKTNKGDDIKNKDLWQDILSGLGKCKELGLKVKFVKVKGHSGNTFNTMVDKAAREESKKIK